MNTFPERIEVREGTNFYVSEDGDLYVLREMYEMNVYKVDIKPGMKILDIGAHKGIFSVWAAKQGAEVTAYEPNPQAYEYLIRNVYNNVYGKVHPKQLGVWDSNCVLILHADSENSIGSSVFEDRVEHPTSTTKRAITVISLDNALGNQEWDIVKIDAEGAEYKILLTSNKLNQIKYLTMEWHCPAGQRDCIELHETIDKLKQYFDVPPIDYDWRILAMKRKS
jgi:FkbM family methyltransferase